jgi:membrane protein
MGSFRPRISSAGQKLLFTAELYGKRELANHAAAGAYAFLLSATPAFLVLLFASSRMLRGSNAAADTLKAVLGGILGSETLEDIAHVYFSQPLTGFAAAFGIVNLIWAARLFVVSIQRGLRTIWADSGPTRPVRENLLTFVLEFVFLVSIIALLFLSQAAHIVISTIRDQGARSALLSFSQTASSVLPNIALCGFSYATYRTVPPVRPRHSHCMIGAVLCTISYIVFLAIIGALRNTTRYDLLYGVMGNLILGLINVYMFFSLYFFFAEFVYVLSSFDELLLGRYMHRPRKKTVADRTEASLLAKLPYRLSQRYGEDYKAGQTIFRSGDETSDVYLLREGEVDIYQTIGSGEELHWVSTAKPGEFFGEMAYLLGDRRMVTAVARTPASVLALPAQTFERFLAVDARASRRLVKLLSIRLADTARIAAEAQAQDALSLDDKEDNEEADTIGGNQP